MRNDLAAPLPLRSGFRRSTWQGMVFSRDRRSIDRAQWWASLRTGGNRGTAVPCRRPVFRAAATANSVWRTMALSNRICWTASEVLQTSLWGSASCGPKVPFFRVQPKHASTSTCDAPLQPHGFKVARKSTRADRSFKRQERAVPSSFGLGLPKPSM